MYADIDLHMIGNAKAAADPAEHYSRPDSTHLLLNRKKQTPVVNFDDVTAWEEIVEQKSGVVEASE